MNIYMISNRNIIPGSNPEKFDGSNNQPANPIFRVAKCKIIGGNKVQYDILADTSSPDYEKVIAVIEKKLDKSELGGTEAMFYDLYESMKSEKAEIRSDVLFFIHGFATSLDGELEHILKLKELYMDNSKNIKNLIYLSWPSADNKVLTYWSDKRDAFVTGQALARVYINLNKFFSTMFRKYEYENCKQKIHLMAHSMGNQVLKQMLGELNESYILPFVGEAILAHADINFTSFEKTEPMYKLQKLAQRIHIYVHKGDDALSISTTTKNFSKRLGKVGPSNDQDLESSTIIVDVTGIKYLKAPTDSILDYKMNVIVDHWGYMYSEQMILDIRKVLEGVDEGRIESRVRHDKKLNYFYLQVKEFVDKIYQ